MVTYQIDNRRKLIMHLTNQDIIDNTISIDMETDYSNISFKELEESIKEFYYGKAESRQVKMYTNVYGYDLFEECMEGEIGYKRVYIGRKVPRILRKLKITIRQAHSGRFYKLIKNG